MRLFLEDEGALDLKLPYEELATKVADAVLDYEKCPYEAQVELLLTMNEEIRQMNLEFRGIDRATDVLSFPMTEFRHRLIMHIWIQMTVHLIRRPEN